MKPEQLRERMELFGFGKGKKESDLFLRDVCDEYENLYYSLVEKEDKVNALNDAVKYYKNMEDYYSCNNLHNSYIIDNPLTALLNLVYIVSLMLDNMPFDLEF